MVTGSKKRSCKDSQFLSPENTSCCFLWKYPQILLKKSGGPREGGNLELYKRGLGGAVVLRQQEPGTICISLAIRMDQLFGEF